MKRSCLAVAGLLLAAVLLRLHGLAAVPFWCDEAYTALTATHITPLRSLLAIEHSPPLYYLFVMAPWAQLGGGWNASELWFRLPSVLAGMGTVMMAGRLGHRLGGRRAAFMALLLTAVSAYLVAHSREARSYAFAAFFSFWALVETIEVVERSSRAAWIRLGVALLGACYTHYVQVIFGVACAATILGFRPEKRSLFGLGIILAGGLAAFAPWYAYLNTQLFHDTFYSGVWQGDFLKTLHLVDGPLYIARLLAWALLYNIPPHLYFKLYTALPALTLVFGAFALWSRRREKYLRVALTLALLILAQAAVFWIIRAVGEPVYLLAFFPFFWSLVAAALSAAWDHSLTGRVVAAVLLACLLAVAAIGNLETYANRFHLEDRLTRDPWPAVATALRNLTDPTDAVVVVPGWPSPGGWYLRQAAPYYQIWVSNPYFRRTAPYARLTVGDPREMASTISDSAATIWLVHFMPHHYPEESTFFPRLESGRRLQEHGTWGRLTLSSLTRDSAPI